MHVLVCRLSDNCKQYGIPHCVHSMNVPGLCLHIWPDDFSFETKHVAEFLILITIYIVVLLTGINYCTLMFCSMIMIKTIMIITIEGTWEDEGRKIPPSVFFST